MLNELKVVLDRNGIKLYEVVTYFVILLTLAYFVITGYVLPDYYRARDESARYAAAEERKSADKKRRWLDNAWKVLLAQQAEELAAESAPTPTGDLSSGIQARIAAIGEGRLCQGFSVYVDGIERHLDIKDGSLVYLLFDQRGKHSYIKLDQIPIDRITIRNLE